MKAVSEELLTAYVDGELDAGERARIERAIADDPGLAARVARHRALRSRLQSHFSTVLHEPVPERLLAATHIEPAHIIDLARVRAQRGHAPRRTLLPRWAAVAASAVLGVLAGLMLQRWPSGALTEYRAGALLARGTLARALTDQLASDTSGRVSIGLTFRDRAGHYCRTFAVAQNQPAAGLACREGDSWEVFNLLRVPTGTGADGSHYRLAASHLPSALLAAVNERISGEALDASAEAAARQAHWQP